MNFSEDPLTFLITHECTSGAKKCQFDPVCGHLSRMMRHYCSTAMHYDAAVHAEKKPSAHRCDMCVTIESLLDGHFKCCCIKDCKLCAMPFMNDRRSHEETS